ncbi:MAG: two-component system, chemotaxis family, protein-glutamate methylesterase/glutaminase [Blastocatellia bacterium]|nr:two-component system, chemotaxis family, protein-glutamate methylesterase/glutaminase [Blastocatellia bacterium]
MLTRDIIVIGASAGGIEALRTIARGLPQDFPASVFVVLHTAPQSPGILADILARAGALPASNALDKEAIQHGRIYVAPPDHHLVIEPNRVRITRGPKENRFRPAVDPLFRSAAQVYGPRVIGLILTGNLDDGTAGLWAVKRLGGTAIVQDPEEALAPSMPHSAMRQVKVDHCLPVGEIAPLLARLASTPMTEEGERQAPKEMKIEVRIAKEDVALDAGVLTLGEPSNYACPECHGVLLQLNEEQRIRFRCHTGHAYSVDSLLSEITKGVEDSLWNAIRAIEESVLLLRHMARSLTESENSATAERYLAQAQEAERRADFVRQAVITQKLLSEAKLNDVKEP